MVKNALKTALYIGLAGILVGQNVWAEDDGTEFTVSVRERLTVSVTAPTQAAAGQAGTFVRNYVAVRAATNGASGITAKLSMTEDATSADLVQQNPVGGATAATISTLGTSSTRGDFPTNAWGFSVEGGANGDTSAGLDTSVYLPVPLYANAASLTSQNTKVLNTGVYFGAKAGTDKPADTYAGTVVIAVVSGMEGPDPSDNPQDVIETNDDGSKTTTTTDGGGRKWTETVATTEDTEDNTETTTKVIDSYQKPQGVTYEETIGKGSELGTLVAVSAATLATGGMIFFAVAKKREEDEDEE